MDIHLGRRHLMAWSTLLVAALTLTSCTGTPEGQPAENTSDEVIQYSISDLPGIIGTFLPHFGAEEGVFQRHGIDLEFVKVNGGPAGAAALASGTVDFGFVSPPVDFPLIDSGAEIVYLMRSLKPDYTVIAQHDLGARDLTFPEGVRQLKGKTLGVSAIGSLHHIFARQLLKSAGLDPDKDVTIVSTGTGSAAIAAFSQKQVDAMVGSLVLAQQVGEENYAPLFNAETTKNLVTEVWGPNVLVSGYGAPRSIVKSDPDRVVAFCDAMKETLKLAKQEPAKTSAFLSRYLGLTNEQATTLWAVEESNFDLELTRSAWEAPNPLSLNAPSWEANVFSPCTADG